MTVNKNNDNELTTRCNGNHDFNTDCLETVFENGVLKINYSWEFIKENCKLK